MKYVIVSLAVVLAALLGIIAASCGVGSGAQSAGPVPTVEPGGSTDSGSGTATAPQGSSTGGYESSTAGGEGTVLQVWFTRGESLYVVTRTADGTARVGTAALQALLQAPDQSEQGAGIGSQVPPGTQLLGLAIDNGIATVDLTSEFESGGGSTSMNMRIAQIV